MPAVGQTIEQRPNRPFYIELAITHKGDLAIPDKTTFYAVLTEAQRGKDAQAEAFDMARKAHPDAEKITFFFSRTGTSLSEHKAEKIRQQMIDGTWEGWDFG